MFSFGYLKKIPVSFSSLDVLVCIFPHQILNIVLTLMSASSHNPRSLSISDLCRVTAQGKEYIGKKSTTISGKTCQKWSLHTPHSHDVYSANRFPDSSFPENYCRNPHASSDGPWCYTVTSTRWETCGIKYCNEC